MTSFTIRSSIGTYDEDWFDDGFHHHPTVEISIVLEGRGLFEWNERKIVETGHIVVVPPDLPHRYAAVSSVRFGVIHLLDYAEDTAELLGQLVDLSGAKPSIAALSRLDKERFERLFREWLRIKASSLKDTPRNYAAWTHMMLLFLLEHSQADLHAMTVTKAADYIRENLQQNVQMSDLSELAGLTVAGFRRLFEQIYGMSPKRYQQQCRMNEAKWLLSSTGKDIQEIAEQIGFERLHSFSQWFKESEGLSPTAWRRRLHMKSNGSD
ncbi:helix-turn-helix domain-containing protein [Paenibacillus sp. MBLB4367]|uniref:helix-turn-helix domain-containing protein n=1 Tax=Paenibacillus sp. MBLB4367 TaxID=3384767 RepID=UPI003907F468